MITTQSRLAGVLLVLGLLTALLSAAPPPAEAQVALGYQIGWSDFGNHYLINPDGSNNTLQGPARGGDFDWTPDGLFSVNVDGATTVLTNANGAQFPLDGIGGGPELSPDGTMIAHTAFDQDLQEDVVHIIDAQGGLLATLDPPGRDPTWSPDGSKVAYASREVFTRGCPGDTRPPQSQDEPDEFNPHGLRVANVPSNLAAGGGAEIGSSWLVQPSESGGGEFSWYEGMSDPDWGPDGQLVFFGEFETRVFDPEVGNFGDCVSGSDPEEDDLDILVVGEGGGSPTNLTHGAEWIGDPFPNAPNDLNPSFSPDGQWIAFASDRNVRRDGGVHSLFLMPAGGGSAELLLATERVDATDWRTATPEEESVRIEALDPDAGEVGTSGTNGGNFTIERTSATDTDLEVSIRVKPESTATAGVDYVELPTTVTIPEGSNLVNLIVAPIPDDIDEPAETVIVEITDVAGHIIGEPREATVTIADARTSREEAIAYAALVALSRFDNAGNGGFAGAGRQPAAAAVLARADVFADALTGSVLTGDAPMLFTERDSLASDSAAQIQRILEPGGTVYLLGGEAALSAAVEEAVTDLGYAPRRLSGPTRIETAVAIAEEAVARGGGSTVALARAFGPEGNPTAAWVDSVAAGGWAADTLNPIVLVSGDALPAAVQGFLDDTDEETVVVIGGEAAVAAGIADEAGATRVGGVNRFDTAAQIATQLWAAPGDQRLIANGTEGDGWNYALAGAGLSADNDAPLLLTGVTSLPPETNAALCGTGTRLRTEVLGPPRLVTQSVRNALTQPC